MRYHFTVLLSFILLTIVCNGKDVTVQMLSKRIVNKVNDRYINYSIDAMDLLDICISREIVSFIFPNVKCDKVVPSKF